RRGPSTSTLTASVPCLDTTALQHFAGMGPWSNSAGTRRARTLLGQSLPSFGGAHPAPALIPDPLNTTPMKTHESGHDNGTGTCQAEGTPRKHDRPAGRTLGPLANEERLRII